MFSADFLALTAEKQKCHPQARPIARKGLCEGGTVRVPLARKIRARGSLYKKGCAPRILLHHAKKTPIGVFFVVEEDGFEPSKSLTTDLQSAPFGHSGTPPYSVFGLRWWSWWTDSNPRPADYKSAALPAELHQRIRCDYITIPFGMGKVKTQFTLFCRKSKAAAFPAGAAVFFPSG